MPYFEGCVSISRAARSGPGLILFKVLMLPAALLLFATWTAVRRRLLNLYACPTHRAGLIGLLGAATAVFLVMYVLALGNDGDWYRWQRRYGVIIYFGGTALAQLMLVWVLWPQRLCLLSGRLLTPISALTGLVTAQWLLGVFSSVKRLIFNDPAVIDQVENIIEWWYALHMALAFLAIAWILSFAIPEEP